MPEEPTDTMAKAKPSAPPEIHALPGAPEQTADTPPATELSIGEGPGVSHIKLPDLVRVINKYEKLKDERCAASTKEIEAKGNLAAQMHAHREELPVNAEGFRFYAHEERIYVLEEKLKIRNADDGADQD